MRLPPSPGNKRLALQPTSPRKRSRVRTAVRQARPLSGSGDQRSRTAALERSPRSHLSTNYSTFAMTGHPCLAAGSAAVIERGTPALRGHPVGRLLGLHASNVDPGRRTRHNVTHLNRAATPISDGLPPFGLTTLLPHEQDGRVRQQMRYEWDRSQSLVNHVSHDQVGCIGCPCGDGGISFE